LLLEEFGVLRIGAGIATLDITDAELVEKRSDLALVLEREIDACHLRAIAQRRVEEMQALTACSAEIPFIRGTREGGRGNSWKPKASRPAREARGARRSRSSPPSGAGRHSPRVCWTKTSHRRRLTPRGPVRTEANCPSPP